MKSIINTVAYCYYYSTPPNCLTDKWPVRLAYNSFSSKRRRSTRSRKKSATFITLTTPNNKSSSFYNDQNTLTSSSRKLKLVLDLNQIQSLTLSELDRFLSSAEDAYSDLRTLITFDDRNRVVFSCRRSTLDFAGAVFLSGFVAVFALNLLVDLGLGLRDRLFRVSKGKEEVVVRRDRSLGGKEVVVARRVNEGGGGGVRRKRTLDNPLSLPGLVSGSGLMLGNGWRSSPFSREQRLPKWWPANAAGEENNGKTRVVDRDEYQREANRIARAISDYRTSGMDVMEHDIIQLRRICRSSGVQVSFDTTNTRDSFYRASINFVLNVCSSFSGYSTIGQIDGEGVQQFISGLANDIGLENMRAARMVSAAVAARTRSCLLQSWALEVQGKHEEALHELSKICPVLLAFPPEEASPEMEMVAHGLGKNLKVEQRELLMDMFMKVCHEDCHRSAADALGLILSSIGVGGDQQDIKQS